jgi:signal transduction histidine kinase
MSGTANPRADDSGHVEQAPTPVLPTEASVRTSRRRATRQAVERLVLPPLRERARDGIWFAAVALGVYSLLIPFLGGEDTLARVLFNVARVVALLLCYRAVPPNSSESRAYAVIAVAAVVVLGTAAILADMRGDMVPLAVFAVTVVTVTGTMFPWGIRAQALITAFAAATIVAAPAFLDPATDRLLGVDGTVATFNAFAIALYISWILERSRTGLRTLVEDARRADDELEELHASLERRVAERTAELEFANRELEGFSYTVSHDLRAPLRTVGGYSQLILEERGGDLDDTSRERLTRIRAASLRMDALIDDMLILARVGRSALRTESVDLGAMAASIVEQLRVEDPSRRVEFMLGEVPRVQGDLALLRIAMDNLLRNAWKFTSHRDAASIAVSGSRIGGHVFVNVTDNGIGFDMRFRAKLFRPFERIHGDERFEGTGVGLATVARIAHRHGGRVDARGTPGEGATFSIKMPAAGPPRAAQSTVTGQSGRIA